jgi:hypothetical protein
MNEAAEARFLELSVELTGYDRVVLLGTGQLTEYLDEFLNIVDNDLVARLLACTNAAEALADPDLGPLARNLAVMWYLGQWDTLPSEWRNRNGASPRDVDHVVSAAAYREGLAWRAAGAHPMGAKAPGYGSWATPPEGAR